MRLQTGIWAPLLFFLFSQRLLPEALTRTTELGPARIGSVYAYAIQANQAAHFTKVDGNSPWLSVTPDGILTGTPGPDAAATAEITVEALWEGQVLRRSFVLWVLPSDCRTDVGDALAWCDGEAERPGSADDQGESSEAGAQKVPEQFTFQARELGPAATPPELDCAPGNYCIVQFHRLHAPRGEFGHFDPKSGFIQWLGFDLGGPLRDPIIQAINGSKVLFSGSVIFRRKVDKCALYSWTVVTQTVDSSNNLIYAAPDISVFCTEDETLLIVLPAHSIWADVYGVPASVKSPTWQPAPKPPKSHYCKTGDDRSGSPEQGILNCDFPASWFGKSVGWGYNRFAVPGVSQGSISVTPWAGATKGTWDVQIYGSTRVWGGYLGAQLMYEHDRKLADDFNSLTTALTYDVRIRNANPFWLCSRGFGLAQGRGCDPPKRTTPPLIGLRPLEWSMRAGFEEAPSLDSIQKGVYLPIDLNFVMATVARVPIVVSPKWLGATKPVVSQLTLAPVAGLEGGFRLVSHPICGEFPSIATCAMSEAQPAGAARCSPQTPATPTLCQQPQAIFRRVAGLDASFRWPYQLTRLILGDRPMTIDFSYRARLLGYAEPFFNDTYSERNLKSASASGAFPETESTGERSYTRATLIVPVSAYLQYRVTWQHGSLPPLFQYVGNEVTVGISFSNPGLSEH